MDTQHRTRQQPPRPAPQRQRGGGGVVTVFVLGLVGVITAFASLASAGDATDPQTHYTLAIVLAVIGSALMILAAIYDRSQ